MHCRTDLDMVKSGGLVQTHTLVSVSQGEYIRSLAVCKSLFICSLSSSKLPNCTKLSAVQCMCCNNMYNCHHVAILSIFARMFSLSNGPC